MLTGLQKTRLVRTFGNHVVFDIMRCNEYRCNVSKAERSKRMTTATTQQTSVSTWAIDPAHSVAEFKVKHMMISNVKGQFTGVSGTLERHEGDVTKSKVEVTIDAASVNTRDAQRDAHLKSADFFEVEKFPTLSFKSTRIVPKTDDELAVEGELTIHGVTHPERLAVEAKDLWGIRGLASRRRPRSTAGTMA
jgi:polyisoprenoid-binding protein YceI